MGQDFDDYSGFQQIPGMPILLQQSVASQRLKKEADTIHEINLVSQWNVLIALEGFLGQNL